MSPSLLIYIKIFGRFFKKLTVIAGKEFTIEITNTLPGRGSNHVFLVIVGFEKIWYAFLVPRFKFNPLRPVHFRKLH